jgi:tetratricopeptide (TPR) repeat protein
MRTGHFWRDFGPAIAVGIVLVTGIVGFAVTAMIVTSSPGLLQTSQTARDEQTCLGHVFDINESIQACDRFLESGEGTAEEGRKVHIGRFYLYRRRGDAYQFLIKELDEAIKIRPDQDAFSLRGAVLLENGDCDGAIESYNQAIQFAPDAGDFGRRGLAYMCKTDYDHAIADYDEAIRLHPNIAFFYMNRAAAWRAKGDIKRAEEDTAAMRRIEGK